MCSVLPLKISHTNIIIIIIIYHIHIHVAPFSYIGIRYVLFNFKSIMMYEYGTHIKPLQSSKYSIEKLIKHTVGPMEIKNSMGASKMTVVHLKKEQ